MNETQSIAPMIERRDILRVCLRGGGLLALGGVAALLGWRNRSATCLRRDPCGGCPLFSGCELPKAKDSKTAPPPSNHV